LLIGEGGWYAGLVGAGDGCLFGRGKKADGTLLVGPGVAVYVGERPALRSLGRVVAWVSGANEAREDAVGPRVLVDGEALEAHGRAPAPGRVVFVDERTAAGRLLALTQGRVPSVRVPKDTSVGLRAEQRMVARLFGALGLEAEGFAGDDFAERMAPLEMRGLASSEMRRGGATSLTHGRHDTLPRDLQRAGLSLTVASEWYRVAGPLAAHRAGISDEELRRHFSRDALARSSHFLSRLGLAAHPPAHVGLLFGSENEAIPAGSTCIAVTDWRGGSAPDG
jgi:hypothetical protein